MSAVIYAFICVFIVFLPLIYAGLVFWPVAAILCLSLMMIEEAVDVRETANAFETASKKAERFAPGDLRVLSILKKVTPRLSIYYFLLALLFAGCFLLLPYAFPTLLLSWTYFAGLISGNVSAAAIPLAIVSTTLSIAGAMVTLFILGRRLKARVFGFPPSDHLTSALSGDIRRRLVYEKMQEVLESDPDEATW